jgi:hypothetical protein
MTTQLNAPIDAPAIIAALSQQQRLYTELESLSQRQSAHVASGDADDLMIVIAARTRILDQLAAVDRTLTPYRGQWQETLDQLPVPERTQIAGLLQQVQQLLSLILARDESDQKALTAQKESVAMKLTHAATGRQVNRAYAATRRV